MNSPRTKDGYQKTIDDFISEVYIICPSCTRQALVKNLKEKDVNLICAHCGFNKKLSEKPDIVLLKTKSKTITGKYKIMGGAIDPYFHLPLWLTTECCNDLLWAYNYEHLEFLKNHIEAKLRERNTENMSNRSIGSRLPQWMASKKNRAQVLKAIEFLRKK